MTTQHQIDFGRVNRDKGIKKSADSAGIGWCERAFRFLKWYIHTGDLKKHFIIEDVRSLAKSTVFLEDPLSLRSWGSVTQRAVREGLIKRVGYTQVRNPRANMATASVWRKV